MFTDTDVRVACLTCYGAVLSTSAPLAEVEEWLTATQPPWLLQWCHSVLAPPNRHAGLPVKVPVAVQTEAIQVLAAAVKFYFPSLRCHWQLIRELSFTHLATPQQQHSLKVKPLPLSLSLSLSLSLCMCLPYTNYDLKHILFHQLLEELCRAVSDQHTTTALQMWELLLSGPLTPLLQSPSNPSICAQAYAVLSTLGPSTMDQLNVVLLLLFDVLLPLSQPVLLLLLLLLLLLSFLFVCLPSPCHWDLVRMNKLHLKLWLVLCVCLEYMLLFLVSERYILM